MSDFIGRLGNKVHKSLIVFLYPLIFQLSISKVHAGVSLPGGGSGFCFDADGFICADPNDPVGFIRQLGTIAIFFGVLVTAIMVVSGAYKLMQSGGDQNKVRDGREQITNALMGMALIIAAGGIITIAFNAVGL